MIFVYFLIALILTEIIECTSMFLMFKSKRFVYYISLCNLLTNPAVNLIALGVGDIWGSFVYKLSIPILEISVVIIEAYIIRLLCRFTIKKAVLVSAILNSLSFVCGLVFFAILR